MTSLRTKLTVLLAAPLVVLVIVAGAAVRSTSAQRAAADRAGDHLDLALSAQDAALALIQERRLSATDPGSEGLDAQRDQTDHAIHVLHARLPGTDDAAAADLDVDAASDAIAELGTVREAVDAGDPPEEVLLGFSQIVDSVLALDAGLGDPGDPDLYLQFQAQRALVRMVDGAAWEESLVHGALAGGTVTETTGQQLTTSLAEQATWTDRFREAASSQQRDEFVDLGSVPSVTTAERLRDRVLLAAPATPPDASTTAWATSMDKKIDLLVDLVGRGADDLEESIGDHRAAVGGSTLQAVGLLAAAVAGFALLLLALRRLAVRPLQDLATNSQAAADDLVEAVRDGELDPHGEAHRPLPLPADDELSDIADAFNTVQGAVVTLAAEQAATRDDIHQVFVNFGRRAQNLVTRQLGQIDDLEARTDDPDVLSDLFMLDHLSTRLRRNAESMVVLAGAESPRPWARPVSVINVVRAAAAEATDYSRVDVANISAGAIAGATANDVSHLLAELIDNALTYSPPGSRVYIAGEAQSEGRYLVAVADAGLGMSPSQLAEANARLSGRDPGTAGSGDVPLAKYFGLYVVSQLARRHGIAVRLVPSRHNGIQAEIMLPRSIMVLPGGFNAPELAAQPDPAGDAGPGPQVRPDEPVPADQAARPNLTMPPGLVTRPPQEDPGPPAPSHAPPAPAPSDDPLPAPPPPGAPGFRPVAGEPSPVAGTTTWPPGPGYEPPGAPPPITPPLTSSPAGPPASPPPGTRPAGPDGSASQPGAPRTVRRRTVRPRPERPSAEHPFAMPAADDPPAPGPNSQEHDGGR